MMGRLADQAGIHFRLLNRSKGPAVRGPRAQIDRGSVPRSNAGGAPDDAPNLTLVEGSVEDLALSAGGFRPWCSRRRALAPAGAWCSTTGTFLTASFMSASEHMPAGRIGEPPSLGSRATLRRAGSAAGPAEDRHAAPARRQDDRLGRARAPAGG